MSNSSMHIEWFEQNDHLTSDALNELAAASRDMKISDAATSHLASCALCQEHLSELRGTIALLQQLTEVAPSRSFQIAPKTQKQNTRSTLGDISQRIQSIFTPAYPALRVATAAVFLLLVSVSVGDLWSNRDSAPDQLAQVMTTPTADSGRSSGETQPAGGLAANQPEATRQDEAITTAGGGIAPAAPAMADSESGNQASDTSLAESTSVTTEPPAAGADQSSDAMQEEAVIPVDQESAPAETSLETVTSAGKSGDASLAQLAPATVEPAAAATGQLAGDGGELAESQSSESQSNQDEPSSAEAVDDDGLSRWRVAEIALLLLLAWLIVTWIGIERTKRKS